MAAPAVPAAQQAQAAQAVPAAVVVRAARAVEAAGRTPYEALKAMVNMVSRVRQVPRAMWAAPVTAVNPEQTVLPEAWALVLPAHAATAVRVDPAVRRVQPVWPARPVDRRPAAWVKM